VTDTPAPLRIANCSGFFGDRIGAAKEMVEGGPIDVLMGDWLAELTMYILHKTRQRSGGYARTFLRQLEDVLPTCIERGITVVSNAGGLWATSGSRENASSTSTRERCCPRQHPLSRPTPTFQPVPSPTRWRRAPRWW
jgi:hypothetical protein